MFLLRVPRSSCLFLVHSLGSIFGLHYWKLFCAMEQSDASSVSTASSPANLVEHNVWNPMMELLFHVQIGGIFEIYMDEFDLARIALSCHYALQKLCDTQNALLGTIALDGGVKGIYVCTFALSHTFWIHIHNLWHRSGGHLLNSALFKMLMEINLHHFDYVFHYRMNRNVPDLLLNPFRHSLLLDPFCDLHLWIFLFFHLFLHMLEFNDILCRLTCKLSVMAPLPRLQNASSWPSVKLASTTAGGHWGETITEQPSFSATKLRGSVPVRNFEEVIPGVLHRRQQVYVSRWRSQEFVLCPCQKVLVLLMWLSHSVRVVRQTAEWCIAVAISIFMDKCPWRKKVRRRRSRRRRLALTSEEAICPESDASVKSINAVLGKVCLLCLQPSKSSVHAPLLWSRQLDL